MHFEGGSCCDFLEITSSGIGHSVQSNSLVGIYRKISDQKYKADTGNYYLFANPVNKWMVSLPSHYRECFIHSA